MGDEKEVIWESLSFMGFSNYKLNRKGQLLNVNRNNILKGTMKHGRLHYCINNDENVTKSVPCHRLLALTFLDTPFDITHSVDHIDRDATNYDLDNLRWASPSEQANNQNRPKNKKGRRVYQYTIEGVFIKKWDKISEANTFYNISSGCIQAAIQRNGTCCGFKWKYNEEVEFDETEIWKLVPYKYLNDVWASNKGHIKHNERILEGCIHQNYMNTRLKNIETGKSQAFLMHRLVAAAWYGENILFVNHINGNYIDNRPENLEYTTNAENLNHAVEIGLIEASGVRKYDLDGNFIEEFSTFKKAFETLNIKSISNIYECCNNHNKNCGGFRWAYPTELNIEFIEPSLIERKVKTRAVNQLDLNGNFIKKFLSIKDAAESLGISSNPIWGCCNGIYKTGAGYKWSYAT